jgi:hypothetical protein
MKHCPICHSGNTYRYGTLLCCGDCAAQIPLDRLDFRRGSELSESQFELIALVLWPRHGADHTAAAFHRATWAFHGICLFTASGPINEAARLLRDIAEEREYE